MLLTDLQLKDQKFNWHPYTQHKTARAEIAICKGKDALLWDEKGDEYIDAIASWWTNPFGHCNTEISEAIYTQSQVLEHVLFGGFTHPKAIELSEKLIELLPYMQKVFYSDNGSTSVEVALKMSLQYFINQGIKKNTIICFEDAFHGDTFGAMSVSGIGLFNENFKSNFEIIRIPIPTDENFEEVKSILINYCKSASIFAFIFEPLVLGAAGMKMYKAKHLDELIKICQDKKIICIADEVMTGFGKTGKLFAIDFLTNKPDIICLSKALTGGFIPMSATICKSFIYEIFHDSDSNKAFFHGHTFTANPLGCAAALASIKLAQSVQMHDNIQRIQQKYNDFIPKLNKISSIKNVRTLGVILAFEIESNDTEYYGNFRNKMYNYFIDNNIILRPIGNTIYILPPYVISNNQIDKVINCILNYFKV